MAGGGAADFKDMMPAGVDRPPVSSEAANEPYLLVTPKIFLSYEAACDVYSAAGERVTFRCAGEHTGDLDFVATLAKDEVEQTPPHPHPTYMRQGTKSDAHRALPRRFIGLTLIACCCGRDDCREKALDEVREIGRHDRPVVFPIGRVLYSYVYPRTLRIY